MFEILRLFINIIRTLNIVEALKYAIRTCLTLRKSTSTHNDIFYDQFFKEMHHYRGAGILKWTKILHKP